MALSFRVDSTSPAPGASTKSLFFKKFQRPKAGQDNYIPHSLRGMRYRLSLEGHPARVTPGDAVPYSVTLQEARSFGAESMSPSI